MMTKGYSYILRARFITVVFCLTASLLSCAQPTIRAHAVAPLNVNSVNESTPVDLRFFQLSDDQPFISTPFDTLWLEAPKVLGNTLQGPIMVRTLFPGVVGDPPVILQLCGLAQQTRFIGVLGLFRTSDGTPRQLVIPIEQLDRQVLEVRGSTLWIGECPLPPPGAKKAESDGKIR